MEASLIVLAISSFRAANAPDAPGGGGRGNPNSSDLDPLGSGRLRGCSLFFYCDESSIKRDSNFKIDDSSTPPKLHRKRGLLLLLQARLGYCDRGSRFG